MSRRDRPVFEERPRYCVTETILREAMAETGASREQLIAFMEQTTGGPVEVVRDFPGGEVTWLVCEREHLIARDVEGTCCVCLHQLFHRPNIPKATKLICRECAVAEGLVRVKGHAPPRAE